MRTYVALYHGSGTFVSWAIKLFTRSKYSHAELWFPEKEVVISADSEGVVAKPIPEYTDRGKGREVDLFYYTPLLSETCHEAVYATAMSYVGHKYDYLMTFVGFPMRLPQSKASRIKEFCSEVVFLVFQKVNRPLLSRTQGYKISPRDLALSPHLRFKKKVILV